MLNRSAVAGGILDTCSHLRVFNHLKMSKLCRYVGCFIQSSTQHSHAISSFSHTWTLLFFNRSAPGYLIGILPWSRVMSVVSYDLTSTTTHYATTSMGYILECNNRKAASKCSEYLSFPVSSQPNGLPPSLSMVLLEVSCRYKRVCLLHWCSIGDLFCCFLQ